MGTLTKSGQKQLSSIFTTHRLNMIRPPVKIVNMGFLSKGQFTFALTDRRTCNYYPTKPMITKLDIF